MKDKKEEERKEEGRDRETEKGGGQKSQGETKGDTQK